MSVLDRDLLYEIAEKMLCPSAYEYRVDLCEASNFMFINNDCKIAFLAQFSKMKCVDISFRMGVMEVNLYKDKNYHNRGFGLEYKGPYTTNSAFINLLMQHGRFRPRSIYMSDVFSNRADAVDETHSVPNVQLAPIQVLATILDLKQFCAPSESYSLDSVQFHETKGCLMDLGLVLALNAEETTMELEIDGYHCAMKSVKNSNATAAHIQTLTLTFNSQWDSQTDDNEIYKDFPHDEWIDVLSSIFSACTSLKKLYVRVNLSDSYDACTNLLAASLQKSIDSITKIVLPKVYKDNPPPMNSMVDIEFYSFLNYLVIQDIPVNEYELFKFGERKPADEGDVVRTATFDRNTLKIVDGGGFVTAKNVMAEDSTKKLSGDFLTNEEDVQSGCVVRFAIYRSVDDDSDINRQLIEDIFDDSVDVSENDDFDVDDVIDYYEHDLDEVNEY